MSRPVFDADGNPVVSREAVERRDRLVEHLAALPSVQPALDQIVWHFGPEQVAEVTGRSKRVVRKADPGGDRLSAESRPARSEEHTSALRSLMRISYAVSCFTIKTKQH